MRQPQPCCVCNDLTKYTCVDCVIDKGTRVYLCAKDECRDKHKKDCTALTNNSRYKYAFDNG